MSTDCCIIGGGIIGLSIARELAGRGHRVRLIARDPRRSTSSWAAAGILPPAAEPEDGDPCGRLTALSDRLHWRWAEELRAETGVDTGLRRCGGIYVARTAAALGELRSTADRWRREGVSCEWLDPSAIAAAEPALAAAVDRGGLEGGFLVPSEACIRTPWHLEALERSCHARGVDMHPLESVDAIEVAAGRVTGVRLRTSHGVETATAARYVVAAGAWSGGLARQLGLALDTRPIRGQIALLRFPRPVLGRIVNHRLDYLVPREDGRMLVGSTLEDVGFDAVTVPDAIERLLEQAADLLGQLAEAITEQVWAGLRPGSADGLPTIGPIPGVDNAFVATGHYRAGIHQSPGTAAVVADLVEGRSPEIDISAFAADRAALGRRRLEQV